MRPGAPDVVLRPAEGDTAITLGPGFITVTGAEVVGTWTRGLSSVGAAARLRAHVADEEDPRAEPPEIRRLSIVDGRANILTALPWNGTDHAGLEAACATARMPLDRVPDGVPRYAGPPVAVAAPGPGSERFRRDRLVSIVIGEREVAVEDPAGTRMVWPRLGCAPAEHDAVARLGITLRAGSSTARTLSVSLLATGGHDLATLSWVDGDLRVLRRACANSGLLAVYRWRAADQPPGPDSGSGSKSGSGSGPGPGPGSGSGSGSGPSVRVSRPPAAGSYTRPARLRPPARLSPLAVAWAMVVALLVVLAAVVVLLSV